MSVLLPPCTNTCPVRTDVRGYLAAITRRDYVEAYRLIRANNPFPSVCAWVCPHPCEDNCRRAGVDEPLSIRDLKRFAVEASGGGPVDTPDTEATGKKIAVVGAGPAGLTAAYDLVRGGHSVVVFDRLPSPGGHFLTSLPTYRLPREILNRDVEVILSAGVEFRGGVEVGVDITISQLKNEYDAVIIGTGLWGCRGLNLPGFDLPGVLMALPYLKLANLGEKPELGRRVIVIGGGDVAMDVARTALRLGASEVTVTCMEPREQMPAHIWELEDALAEGVNLLAGCGPVEILSEGESITGLTIQKVISVFDQEGRFNPSFEPDSHTAVPGETVILAIGQCPDNTFLEGSSLETDARGCLILNRAFLTTGIEGIFACGEIATGPGPAIAAVASGHRVAETVDSYLKLTKSAQNGQKYEAIGPLPTTVAQKVPHRGRQKMPVLPPAERNNNFLPYELGLNEGAALCEAVRCLNCGLGATVDKGKCAACLTCQRVCPYGVPLVEGRARMPEEGCQACGICAAACPADAITIGTLDGQAVLNSLNTPAVKENTVIFACRGLCSDSPGLEGLKHVPGLENACLIDLPTVGALRLEWLFRAFENGASGAAVVACGTGQCRYAGGTAPLEGALDRAKKLLEQLGVGAGRLYYCRPGEGENPVELLAGFARRLEAV